MGQVVELVTLGGFTGGMVMLALRRPRLLPWAVLAGAATAVTVLSVAAWNHV